MSVAIIGTVAFDTIETPVGKRDRLLGGSATFSGIAASLYDDVSLISIVGDDFEDENFKIFHDRGIDISGISRVPGKTFHWKGYYTGDMNQAHTVQTDLNVLMEFDPIVPDHVKESDIVFLANIHPVLQKKALDQFTKPKCVILDTMNFWIESERDSLLALLPQIDVLIVNDQEIRLLTGESNIIKGLSMVIDLGVNRVIVKKGEHGSIMYNGETMFMCPAFPLINITDPTGAGDSFAGGAAGFIGKHDGITEEIFKKAMIQGTIVSSHTVQGFSLDKLKGLTAEHLELKYKELKGMTDFPVFSI